MVSMSVLQVLLSHEEALSWMKYCCVDGFMVSAVSHEERAMLI